MIGELLMRIRFLLFRKKRSEFDEELRFHLEQSIAEKVAQGASAAEARRQALIEFGGVEVARNECERQRPGWWIGTVALDLRNAVRGILAHPWFSAAIIATLALGIGLNTMVFTLVNAVLYKPVPVPGGDRLVCIDNHSLAQVDNGGPVSYPDFQDYRAQASSFEWFEATNDENGILTETGIPPHRYHVARATAGVFSMVQTKALLGRAFLPADDHAGAAPVVVLSYNVWQERYAGLASVIGRPVRVGDNAATIVGVMPKGFRFPSSVDLWMPLTPTADLAKRDNRRLRGYAILKPGVTLRQANAELNGIAERLAIQFPADKDLGVRVQTFQQHFNGGNIRIVFLLMLAAVGFVLLIACADVANLMLSRALSRQRQMSIRTALGATRWRLIRQLLIESVTLSTVGGVLGLGLAEAGIHWFDLSTQTIRPSWIEFTMDFTVFGYFAALCILSGVLFGIAPALRSSKPDLAGVLKEGAHSVGRSRGGWLSATLVVFQFALTLVLLTGAGIFVRALLNTLAINPSVPATHLTMASLQLPDSRYKDADARERFYDQLLPRLRQLPGVSHAAIASDGPGLGANRQQIEFEHEPIANPAQRPWVSFLAQSPGYLETIHLPLLEGRPFSETDGTPYHEAAILTRDAAARLWPGQIPMGKRFRLFDNKNKPTAWITVVGISADISQEIQENDPRPLLFVPYRQEGYDNMAVVVESAADPLPAMRTTVQSLDPELPLNDPSVVKDAMEHQTWFLRVFGRIFLGFALIALLMASVGIYAVIAHAMNGRTQEIGVRLALGATMSNIMLLVMKRGLWQIASGLVLGLAAALPVAHLMASLPFGAAQSDVPIFLVVALCLASVGVFACWLPARRAASLDPVKAIRDE
jgi:putative ABC transport system permease protein